MSRTPINFTLAFFLYLAPFLLANANPCSDGFSLEASKINITENCKKKTLGAEFGYNYHNKTRVLEIVFGARLDSETGWLAWGLNPYGPHMAGTRALIGIKGKDGLHGHKYNITDQTKRGCQLLPIDNYSDLDIRDFNFTYLESIAYYLIRATIVLPKEYDSSRTSIVWQIGNAVIDDVPMMHPTTLHNFDCAETIDLLTNRVQGYYTTHQRRSLRTAHGILNIVGWGTLLPLGTMIPRYFRKFPVEWTDSWRIAHVGCQISGYLVGFSGWVLGLWLGRASKYYCFYTHRTLAIFVFIFSTIQMLALQLKPDTTDQLRTYWNIYHHFLGYALLALIFVNIFQGIAIMKPMVTWKWAYIGVLAFLAAIALVLEIFTWTKFGLNFRKKTKGETRGRGQNVSQSGAAAPSSSSGGQPIVSHDSRETAI